MAIVLDVEKPSFENGPRGVLSCATCGTFVRTIEFVFFPSHFLFLSSAPLAPILHYDWLDDLTGVT